jgi:uncharacterized delta-60 repeat protein
MMAGPVMQVLAPTKASLAALLVAGGLAGCSTPAATPVDGGSFVVADSGLVADGRDSSVPVDAPDGGVPVDAPVDAPVDVGPDAGTVFRLQITGSFVAGQVDIASNVSFGPGGIVAGADGSIFVFGHADTGHGEDASTNGHNVIIKLSPAGIPDRSFGVDGVAVVDDSRNAYRALAIRPDGRLVAAGGANEDLKLNVVQFDANGALDSTFGDHGSFVFDDVPVGFADVKGMSLAPDGSVLLVGTKEVASTSSFYILAERVAADGSSVQGQMFQANAGTPPFIDTWENIFVDRAGEILVFGYRATATGATPLVGRLNQDLSLDTTFANGDYARVTGDALFPEAAVRLADGRFAVWGVYNDATGFHWAVLIFGATGDLDPAFPFQPHDGQIVGLAEAGNGAFLVQLEPTQPGSPPGRPEFVVRLSASGDLDPSYAGTGASTGSAYGYGLAVTPDGHAYALGDDYTGHVYVRVLP